MSFKDLIDDGMLLFPILYHLFDSCQSCQSLRWFSFLHAVLQTLLPSLLLHHTYDGNFNKAICNIVLYCVVLYMYIYIALFTAQIPPEKRFWSD